MKNVVIIRFTESITSCGTRNLFYKGQGDFQLVLSLGNFPKLTSCVPFVSLIFSAMIFAIWF